MTVKGIDYSWARPGGAAIKAAGYQFVMRYVPYAGDGGKGLEPDEVADLRANGLAIGLVFESTGSRVLDGFDAGVEDGRTCEASIARIGAPANLPIFFAVDFDLQPDQYRTLDDYLRGAATVLTPQRIGVYAGFKVIEHCYEDGIARFLWQTYAWSYGQVHPKANVYQYLNGQQLNGGAIDLCEAYDQDALWTAQEEEMTKDQFRALFEECMGEEFPAYVEAYFSGGFSARNGIVSDLNPEGKAPIKPWASDIDAAIRSRAVELGRDS